MEFETRIARRAARCAARQTCYLHHAKAVNTARVDPSAASPPGSVSSQVCYLVNPNVTGATRFSFNIGLGAQKHHIVIIVSLLDSFS